MPAVESSPAIKEKREEPVPDMGLGRTARAVDLLARQYGVRPEHIQSTINNPVHRAAVAAVLKGDFVLPTVELEWLVERELGINSVMCEDAGIACPKEDMIVELLGQVPDTWGQLTEHDRVIPAGLGLTELWRAINALNERRRADGLEPIKLCGELGKEFWRTYTNVEYLPTGLLVVRLDFCCPFRIGLDHRPFYLTYDQQDAWSREPQQGGDGITSAEENVYLYYRSVYEDGNLLWSGSSRRCRNGYGSDSTLCVDSDGKGGLSVGSNPRVEQYWSIAALPRKCISAQC